MDDAGGGKLLRERVDIDVVCPHSNTSLLLFNHGGAECADDSLFLGCKRPVIYLKPDDRRQTGQSTDCRYSQAVSCH